MVTTNTPSMKAICFHEYGGPEVLKYENVPRPEPQHGQVLIQVRAAGVGQDVYGFVGIGSGAYAEYTTSGIETIALQPRTLDYVQAASVPLVATTAWQALFEAGGLKEGQTVLVHGGAGGVGTFAVQLAKMKGAYVLATASSQNVEFVKGLGADEVIDYTTTRFETVAHHVDVVLDLIGGETEQRSWGVLKPGGILVSTLGPPSQEDAAKHRVRTAFVQAQPTAGLLKEIARLLDSRQIKPNVGKMFPMEQARQAQELKQHGHTCGKIVLEIAR